MQASIEPNLMRELAGLVDAEPGEDRFRLMCEALQAWAERNPETAYDWVVIQIDDRHLSAQLRAVVIAEWSRQDVKSAAIALLVDDELPGADAPIAAFVRQMARQDPAGAEQWSTLIADNMLRLAVLHEIDALASRPSSFAM